MVFIKSIATLFIGTVALAVHAKDAYTSCKPGYFALTYDDGPYMYTAELLNLLKKEGIKATFFVNGKNFWDLDENDEGRRIIQRAYEEGHQIGSHTWSHKDLTSLSDSEFDSEISQIEELIKGATGKRPTCLRPPYGAINGETISKLESRGYSVVNWNVDTKDYESHDSEKEKEKYIDEIGDASGGYISLSHDVYQQTTTTLTEELIAYVRSKNLKFTTVADCLGVEPYRD